MLRASKGSIILNRGQAAESGLLSFAVKGGIIERIEKFISKGGKFNREEKRCFRAPLFVYSCLVKNSVGQHTKNKRSLFMKNLDNVGRVTVFLRKLNAMLAAIPH